VSEVDVNENVNIIIAHLSPLRLPLAFCLFPSFAEFTQMRSTGDLRLYQEEGGGGINLREAICASGEFTRLSIAPYSLYKRTFPGQLMAPVTELKHGVKFNT
jgi:hypothetical protein